MPIFLAGLLGIFPLRLMVSLTVDSFLSVVLLPRICGGIIHRMSVKYTPTVQSSDENDGKVEISSLDSVACKPQRHRASIIYI